MRYVFDIEPSTASINPRHFDRSKGRAVYQRTLDAIALMTLSQRHINRWETAKGSLTVEVWTFVADGRGVDVDACIKCVLDGLQAGKAIANDKNVAKLIAHRVVGLGRPRIECEVTADEPA